MKFHLAVSTVFAACALAADVGVAVQVAVRAELLDDVDLDRDALLVADELEVLGAHAHGDGGLVAAAAEATREEEEAAGGVGLARAA